MSRRFSFAVIATVVLACVAQSSPAALITNFSFTPGDVTRNLTTEGTTDWIKWGSDTPGPFSAYIVTRDFNSKALGSALTDFVSLGGGTQNADFGFGSLFSWSNGDTTSGAMESARSESGDGNMVLSLINGGVGTGFRLNVPATAATQRVRLYTSVFEAQGTLTATLTDTVGGGTDVESLQLDATPQNADVSGYWEMDFVAGGGSGGNLQLDWVVSQTTVNNDLVTIYALTLSAAEVVPEPSTFALAILGLFGLGTLAWRRRWSTTFRIRS